MLKFCKIIRQRFNTIPKQNVTFYRHISSVSQVNCQKQNAEKTNQNVMDTEIWTKLYHFKEINYFAIVSRLKIYQASTAVILTPSFFALESFQYIPSGVTLMAATMGIGGTVMMSLYSALLNNTIGIIYVCAKNEKARIAYIDFWANRRQVDVKVSDFDLTKAPTFHLYQTIKCTGFDKSLKLPIKHGDIYDTQLYNQLFGQIK